MLLSPPTVEDEAFFLMTWNWFKQIPSIDMKWQKKIYDVINILFYSLQSHILSFKSRMRRVISLILYVHKYPKNYVPSAIYFLCAHIFEGITREKSKDFDTVKEREG